MTTRTPVIALKGVRKRFGATIALDGVDLQVAPGEVHALIGENGAGKSTLMKILSGVHRADAGELLLQGKEYLPRSPLHAQDSGIAMIYQELNLAPDLSIRANMLLGMDKSRLGLIDREAEVAVASKALESLGHADLDVERKVCDLSIGEQQLVEIARACLGELRVLILDEPTSSLTRPDVERLFSFIRRMKSQGMAVLYISHFLEEVVEIADRYTVIRDGRTVRTGEAKTEEIQFIIEAMVGRKVEDLYPEIAPHGQEISLEVNALNGIQKPRDLSLKLHKGEIFGLAGLIGAGRTEALRCLFGLDPVSSGTVTVSGRKISKLSPAELLKRGVGLLSENRKEEGLLLNRSLADNMCLTQLDRFSNRGLLKRAEMKSASEKRREELDIRSQSIEQLVETLSGGNQQKVAIGRLLEHDTEIFLLDEATRGIDLGSKAMVYNVIAELASRGKSILWVSSYLPEMLGMTHRIGVMSRGKLRETRKTSDWNENEIMAVAVSEVT